MNEETSDGQMKWLLVTVKAYVWSVGPPNVKTRTRYRVMFGLEKRCTDHSVVAESVSESLEAFSEFGEFASDDIWLGFEVEAVDDQPNHVYACLWCKRQSVPIDLVKSLLDRHEEWSIGELEAPGFVREDPPYVQMKVRVAK